LALIELATLIAAPRERVFDLARSIEAHQHSAARTQERAVAGVTSGLIGLNGEVTWQARHLGTTQELTVRITAFERPSFFQDVMIRGSFKTMKHDHRFAEHPGGTLMSDRFEFYSPLGVLGWLVDHLFLKAYMRRFLVRRSLALKHLAETDAWKAYLQN